MFKGRVLPVMVARSIRSSLLMAERPQVAEIVDAALEPVRVDCDARRRHHKAWGLYQLGAGVAGWLLVYGLTRWHLVEGEPWWLLQARGASYLVMVLAVVNLSKRRVYGDLVRRLTIVRPSEQSK